jgi:hypothetical protein
VQQDQSGWQVFDKDQSGWQVLVQLQVQVGLDYYQESCKQNEAGQQAGVVLLAQHQSQLRQCLDHIGRFPGKAQHLPRGQVVGDMEQAGGESRNFPVKRAVGK